MKNKTEDKVKIPSHKWIKEARSPVMHTRQKNTITQLPGLKAHARALGTNPNIDKIC